ncbi:MAG: penicillin-binding protein [Planctomycetota bacterium]|nr:MAG: penicillin-binding protein [Planctomycetota bacterium]
MTQGTSRFAAVRRRTGVWVLTGLMALLLSTAGRLAYVLKTDGERLAGLAERQQFKRIVLPARRGSIFDDRGRMLAGTRRVPDAFVDARLLFNLIENEHPDEAAREAAFRDWCDQVAVRLNLPGAKVAELIRQRSASSYVILKRELDESEAAAILNLDDAFSRAVGVTPASARVYPLGSSMAHVVGFVGREGHGLEGIERRFDEMLCGTDGERRTTCTVSRGSLDLRLDGARDPVDGRHVVLTTDAEIQRIVEEQLASAVEKFSAESAVGVVMDPRTGDVLALACVPTYDPNEPAASPTAARRNRAITDPIEPGSCFKPFVGSLALQEGFVSSRESINCHHGQYFFGARRVRDTHPQGYLDLKGIIVHSSNIGIGTIAARMPKEAMERFVRSFGFGAPTGIELPGESGGIVKPSTMWSGYSTVSHSFGQELAVTPLQLVTALCAMVNGGELPAPRIVRGVLNADGSVVEWNEGLKVVRRVLREDVASLFGNEILPAVVEDVQEGNLKSQKYTTLGKTGTAQVPYPNRPGYEPGAYVGSFLGAGPVGDARLAVIVMVRKPNPSKGYYGRTVAGPAVKAILEQSLEYLGVPPDREPKAGVRLTDLGG